MFQNHEALEATLPRTCSGLESSPGRFLQRPHPFANQVGKTQWNIVAAWRHLLNWGGGTVATALSSRISSGSHPPLSRGPRTWGIIVTLKRRSWSPIFAMLIPSMRISPLAASVIRKRPRAREDFPAPVLPTMPIFGEEHGGGGGRRHYGMGLRSGKGGSGFGGESCLPPPGGKEDTF